MFIWIWVSQPHSVILGDSLGKAASSRWIPHLSGLCTQFFSWRSLGRSLTTPFPHGFSGEKPNFCGLYLCLCRHQKMINFGSVLLAPVECSDFFPANSASLWLLLMLGLSEVLWCSSMSGPRPPRDCMGNTTSLPIMSPRVSFSSPQPYSWSH